MTNFILLILGVVVGSALFSGIEAALFSISQARAIMLREQKKRGAHALVAIKENFSHSIIVIVIGNNIVNIVGSLLVGAVAVTTFESVSLGIISAVLTLCVVIFGEIIPKTIGENYAERIALTIAQPLSFVVFMGKPVIWVIEKITKPFERQRQMVSEEELQMLSELGHLEGSIEEDERDIIQRVFTLNDMTAHDIMTPRTMMVGLHKELTLQEAKEEILTLTHSRIPLYGEDYDEIVGICYLRDVLSALAQDKDSEPLMAYVHDVLYVSDDMKADDLLKLFLERRTHIAIVKDEFDGTSGLVTLEDVLEELVGEIVDETDEVVDMREEAERLAEESGIIIEESDDDRNEEDDN